MDWTGDQDAFDRAAVETSSLTAFTRALRSVPPDGWRVVEVRLRVKLDEVHLFPTAEPLTDGVDVADGPGLSEDTLRRATLLEDKKRVLREEDEARVMGAARPA
jgi:hypothetical protein